MNTNKLPTALYPLKGYIYELEFKISPCVYFLCKDRQILYIGQTTNLQNRILQHIGDGKDFDSVFFYEVPEKELSSAESVFIKCFQPIYNNNSHILKSLRKRRKNAPINLNREETLFLTSSFTEDTVNTVFIPKLKLRQIRNYNYLSKRIPRKRKPKGVSGFWGVQWAKKGRKWITRISINGKYTYIGSFDNEIEAAKAYNKAALEHSLNRELNIIPEWYINTPSTTREKSK